MITQKDRLRLIQSGQERVIERAGVSGIGRRALDEAAVGVKHGVLSRTNLKPQNLIGLLKAHGARSRRNAIPRVSIRMSVFTPVGKPAVKIRI